MHEGMEAQVLHSRAKAQQLGQMSTEQLLLLIPQETILDQKEGVTRLFNSHKLI